jgi:aminopeptidase
MAAPVVSERLERYADLAIRVGTALQPGQTVFVNARVEHAPLARAVARAAYRAGARYVDVFYVDQHVRRAMIELGPEDTLEHSPDWLVERTAATAENALVAFTGDPEPALLADLDGERVGRARMLRVAEVGVRLMNERATNWTGLAFPSEGWATQVFGEPDIERLWGRSRSARASTRTTRSPPGRSTSTASTVARRP